MIEVGLTQNGTPVKVTKSGELVTSALSYDLTEYRAMIATGTAYNYYEPLATKQLVITSIIVFADKNVNDTSDTVIEIYEADSDTSITSIKPLLTFGMAKLSVLPIVPLRLLVTEGVWVNAKTDDNNIFLTIMGHYIDA